jgi:hypothetical protein
MARDPNRPSMKRAIYIKCLECIGFMRVDCRIVKCPLYYWQPYRRKTREPDLSWTKISLGKKSRVRSDRPSKVKKIQQ